MTKATGKQIECAIASIEEQRKKPKGFGEKVILRGVLYKATKQYLQARNFRWDGSLNEFGIQLISNLEDAGHCSIEFCENEFSVEQINIIIKTLFEMVEGKIDLTPSK